jgi:hypothetical protein
LNRIKEILRIKKKTSLNGFGMSEEMARVLVGKSDNEGFHHKNVATSPADSVLNSSEDDFEVRDADPVAGGSFLDILKIKREVPDAKELVTLI